MQRYRYSHVAPWGILKEHRRRVKQRCVIGESNGCLYRSERIFVVRWLAWSKARRMPQPKSGGSRLWSTSGSHHAPHEKIDALLAVSVPAKMNSSCLTISRTCRKAKHTHSFYCSATVSIGSLAQALATSEAPVRVPTISGREQAASALATLTGKDSSW